jgi:hypothetical protein
MPAAEYLALSGVAWAAPVMPVWPALVGNASPSVVTVAVEEHGVGTALVHKVINLENKLQQQILEAVPVLFLKVLASQRVGFQGVTAAQMLAHLDTFYGAIKSDDLKANLERAKAPWNPNHPMEGVFEQILDAVDFAAAGGDEITQATAT